VVVLACQVGVLGTAGSLRSFGQCRAEPDVALACPATLAFARGFIVAGTEPGPGRKVARGREAGQISAYWSVTPASLDRHAGVIGPSQVRLARHR
jgi:hypothetical protein